MPDHLSRQELLSYFDGELSASAEHNAKEHLSSCWTCQTELERIKEQIGLVLSAHTELFEPSLPPPPNPWVRLEPRLEEREKTKFAAAWKRFFTASGFSLRSLAYGGAMAAFVFGIFLWLPGSKLTAKEILRNVAAADRARLAVDAQQAVKQRIRIKRTSRNGMNKSVESDVWKTPGSLHWGDGLDVLRARYQSNGIPLELPLSSTAIESWMHFTREPVISREGDQIEVHSSANPASGSQEVSEVRFRVEPNWRVIALTLAFEDETLEITETQTSVVNRVDIPASVLAQVAAPPASTNPSATRKNSLPSTPGIPTEPSTPNADDLEMSVRYAIHGIQADLGEGIDVVSSGPGSVTVNAAGASQGIKEKLNAMFAGRRDVQVILAVPANQTPGTSRRTITQVVASGQAIRDPRLAKVFETGTAQEDYTRSLLQSGSIVLSRLHALQEIAKRWPEDKQLSVKAKGQLIEMVQNHIRELRKGVTVWTTDLDVLLNGLGYEKIPLASGPNPPDWRQASARGLDAALGVDRTIRSLLTVSDRPIAIDEALPQLRSAIADLQNATHSLRAAIPQ